MATPPGITVSTINAPPAGPAGPRTGTWFVTAQLGAGPIGRPISIQSMGDVAKAGGRQPYSPFYDCADLFFRIGGAQILASRVAGPGVVPASLALKDGLGNTTATVSANSPGSWGNALSVAVQAGSVAGTYQLVVSGPGVPATEVSPNLTSPADAVAWSSISAYVSVVNAFSADAAPQPVVVVATALTGGNDDLANVTETQWTNALAVFTADMGPGTVSAPGRTTPAAYQALVAHGTANNRTYRLDPADNPSAAALIAAAAPAQSQVDPGRGGMEAPWIILPGLPTGTALPAPPRIVPPCAAAAALSARSDAITGNPNLATAGSNTSNDPLGAGVIPYAIGVTQTYSDADRGLLNAAGINVIRNVAGVVQAYGFRTLSLDPNWQQLSWQRLRMAITDHATQIAASVFEFGQDAADGFLFSKFNGALSGMLQDYWAMGALFGRTAADAFIVDTGSDVNTPASVAAGAGLAVITTRMSPFVEQSQIFTIKVPITSVV